MCLPIIGAVVSGVGAAIGAMAQSASYKGQAEFERRQAKIETQTGGYKAERTQDEIKRTTGAQRAGFAANGVGLDGSAADTIFDTTEEGALDVAAIRWNSKLASDNLNYKAKLSDMNAGIAKASAIPAFLSPVIGGLAQMSSSFS